MAFLWKFSLTFVLSSVLVFLYPQQGSAKQTVGLKLSKFGPSHIKGKYLFDDSLGIQFDIRSGFMEISSLDGTTIARYMKLSRDTEYVQIADHGFLSRQNKQSLVPMVIPKTPKSLRRFAEERFSDDEVHSDEDNLVKQAHKDALDRLRGLDETRLLEISSKALANAGGSGLTLNITQPYHLMSLNLLLALDKSGKPVDVIRDSDPPMDQEKPSRSKRCADLTGNTYDDCLGMCGIKCKCWKWVCGDCCWHQGCYEHDLCCGKDFWSKYCLYPWNYSFSCSSYGGYSYC